MILTPDSTWVRVANYYEDEEEEPSGVFIEIRGSSNGSHGREGRPDIPAGNPLKSSVSWEFYPEDYPRIGSEFSVWMGQEGGSYHERWVKMFATVGKEPPPAPSSGYRRREGPPKLIGTFKFSDIVSCCKEIVELTGCNPPQAHELEGAIPPKQNDTPEVKPDQANARRPGESPEQYWKRISLEKRGKFYYPGEGGIEREF